MERYRTTTSSFTEPRILIWLFPVDYRQKFASSDNGSACLCHDREGGYEYQRDDHTLSDPTPRADEEGTAANRQVPAAATDGATHHTDGVTVYYKDFSLCK